MFAILRFQTQILDCLAFTFKVIFQQCFACFSFYGRWIFNGLLQKHLLITPSNLAPDCCYKMYIRSIYIWSKSSFLTLLPLCQEKSCRYFSLISMTVLHIISNFYGELQSLSEVVLINYGIWELIIIKTEEKLLKGSSSKIDEIREDKSSLIYLNLLTIRSKIWRRYFNRTYRDFHF